MIVCFLFFLSSSITSLDVHLLKCVDVSVNSQMVDSCPVTFVSQMFCSGISVICRRRSDQKRQDGDLFVYLFYSTWVVIQLQLNLDSSKQITETLQNSEINQNSTKITVSAQPMTTMGIGFTVISYYSDKFRNSHEWTSIYHIFLQWSLSKSHCSQA